VLELNNILVSKMPEVLSYFNVDYKASSKMYYGMCPVHGGDKTNAWNMYFTGDVVGNWYCRTHACEKKFTNTAIGFVRGLLTSKLCPNINDIYPYGKTLKWIIDFLKVKDLSNVLQNAVQDDFYKQVKVFQDIESGKIKQKITRQQARERLQYPCEYFIKRHYTPEILDKYDVGVCFDKDKPMIGRAVFPIYDDDYKYVIGATGRSINEKCSLCSCYHFGKCPDEEKRWLYSKWKHVGILKANCLFNTWFAASHIAKSYTAILVESPGNVLRLEEADIHISLGMLGADLSDNQVKILNKLSILNLIVIADNDSAGQEAAERIKDKCRNLYRVYNIVPSKNDLGDMTVMEINQEIKPQVQKIMETL
jgi:hypothetical protein